MRPVPGSDIRAYVDGLLTDTPVDHRQRSFAHRLRQQSPEFEAAEIYARSSAKFRHVADETGDERAREDAEHARREAIRHLSAFFRGL